MSAEPAKLAELVQLRARVAQLSAERFSFSAIATPREEWGGENSDYINFWARLTTQIELTDLTAKIYSLEQSLQIVKEINITKR